MATLNEFGNLIDHDERFFHFSSDKLVDAARHISDNRIAEWRQWYEELYYWQIEE
ncbi:MAG: hypothetical protein Kow0031_15350 [Anaerolineae bacterium]